MRRAAVIVSVSLLWAAVGGATEYWQDTQNVSGFVPVISPSAGACFLYASAAFDVDCYTSVPASFISGLAANEVLYGSSGGGIAQSAGLTWDDTNGVLEANKSVNGQVQVHVANTNGGASAIAAVQVSSSATPNTAPYCNLSVTGTGTASPGNAFLSFAPSTTSQTVTILNAGNGSGNGVVIATGPSVTPQMSIANTGAVTVNSLSGSGASCVQASSAGVITRTGAACASPLTACTDYVSLACVSGATDLGGTNATPTVIGTEPGYDAHGYVNWNETFGPGAPASGKLNCWADSANDNLECFSSTSVTSVVPDTHFCGASTWMHTLPASGVFTCTQPAFSDVSGSAACGQLPNLTGAISSSGCSTTAVAIPASTVTGLTPAEVVYGGAGGAVAQSADFLWNESADSFQTGTSSALATNVNAQFNGTNTQGRGWLRVGVNGLAGDLNMVADLTTLGPYFVSHTDPGGKSTVNAGAVLLQFGGAGLVVQTSPATAIGSTRTFTTRFSVDLSGNVDVPALSAGGIAKALPTSGQLAIATAGTDYQAPLTACTNYVSLTCVSGGDLGGTNGTPTVTGMTDGGSVDHQASGTWTSSSLLAINGSGHITTVGAASIAAASATKLRYSLQLQLSASTTNTWLLQGGPGLFTIGAINEVPNDFKASTIQVIWYLRTNTVTAGTLTVQATMNGSALTGPSFTVTSATSTGVHVGTVFSTGSSTSADTYGLRFSTDGSFASTSPSSEFVTVEVVLLP